MMGLLRRVSVGRNGETALVQNGTSGNDTLNGSTDPDTLNGRAGNDRISGLANADSLIGGDGADTVIGGGGADTLLGGAGDDRLFGEDGSGGTGEGDTIRGGDGNDSIIGDGGDDSIVGDAGDDAIEGGLGDDTLDGGKGSDEVSYVLATGPVNIGLLWQGFVQDSGQGQDLLRGFEHLYGSPHADVLSGNNGANYIDGGYVFGTSAPGADTINGLGGNDLITLSSRGAVADGGDGRDTLRLDDFLFNKPLSFDLSITGAFQTVTTYGSWTVQVSASNFENVCGGSAGDMIVGDAGANVLYGGGANTFYGGGAGDTLIGGGGADKLYGGGIMLFYQGRITVFEAELYGHDFLSGGDGKDLIVGGLGIDTLSGGEGNDILRGDAEDYVVEDSFNTSGADILDGDGGNDKLFGQAKNDTLRGGAGDDVLAGGSGADRLEGGAGADIFRYLDLRDSTNAESDLITDYAAGDRIDVSLIDANPFKADDQKFALVQENTDFIGEATVEYAWEADVTLVHFWTDGDATADLVVFIEGDVTGFLDLKL